MIERIERLPENTPESVFSARIKALYNTYSESVGVDIFCQTVDGIVTAVFGGMDGSYSLVCLGNADYEELYECFSFFGYSLFCDGDTADRLKPKAVEKCDLYELELKPSTTDFPYCNAHEPINEVYEILQMGTDGDISLPLFDLWYTDFCARFNHKAAEYAVMWNSAAVCGFMTEKVSLVTGIAVKPDIRRKGLGSAALGVLIHNIWGKCPDSKIFAATKTAGGFYEKCKFIKVGTVANCEF